jgi:hypothetical protein
VARKSPDWSEIPAAPVIAASVARGTSGSRSGPGAGPNNFVGDAAQKELPSIPAGIVLSYRSFDADPELSTAAEH